MLWYLSTQTLAIRWRQLQSQVYLQCFRTSLQDNPDTFRMHPKGYYFFNMLRHWNGIDLIEYSLVCELYVVARCALYIYIYIHTSKRSGLFLCPIDCVTSCLYVPDTTRALYEFLAILRMFFPVGGFSPFLKPTFLFLEDSLHSRRFQTSCVRWYDSLSP